MENIKGEIMKKIGAIVFLLILAVIFTGCVEIIPVFEISNFEIEPEKIKPGESVNIKITIKNTGKEMTPENNFKVGVKIVKPRDGDIYWNISEPKLIERLNPNGERDFKFHAESKSDTPPGDSTFKPYIFELDTGKEKRYHKSFFNDEKTVYVKSPEETPAFESIFTITALIAVAYLIRRKRK